MKVRIVVLTAVVAVALVGLACGTDSTLVGDVNEDGVVNVGDITTVELMVAGVLDATPGADVNGDGVLNVLDITAVELLVAECR